MGAGEANCKVGCLTRWSPYKTDGPAWGRVLGSDSSAPGSSAKAEFERCLSGCVNTPWAKHPEPAKYSDFNWGGYRLEETAFYL